MAFDGCIERLAVCHDVSGFDCGVEWMTAWLQHDAMASRQADVSQTYVVHQRDHRVIGYYSLSAGDVTGDAAPPQYARAMPKCPVGVIVLTRLAVDIRFQGRGIAVALLQDVYARVERVSEIVGVRALLVHAINDRAREFYLHHGFVPSPIEPLHLMLAMKDVRSAYCR